MKIRSFLKELNEKVKKRRMSFNGFEILRDEGAGPFGGLRKWRFMMITMRSFLGMRMRFM